MPGPTQYYTFDKRKKRRFKVLRNEPITIEFIEGDCKGCTLRIGGLVVKQALGTQLPPILIVNAGLPNGRASREVLTPPTDLLF